MLSGLQGSNSYVGISTLLLARKRYPTDGGRMCGISIGNKGASTNDSAVNDREVDLRLATIDLLADVDKFSNMP